MQGEIIHYVLASHTPRMGVEEGAPAFVRGLIDGAYAMGEYIRKDKPDVIVTNSTHWVATFEWFVTAHKRHKGLVVSEEAPDLIPGIPYDRPGDPDFAKLLMDEMNAFDVPTKSTANEHFDWDYGTWVPLKYMDPGQTVPVVATPCVIMADIDECLRAGEAVREAAKKSGKRVTVVASTALTHHLVRGPDQWPTPDRMELDKKFIDMLKTGRIAEAKAWFKDYNKEVVGEMGGRVVAWLLGTMDENSGLKFSGEQFGPYSQSSGSGNANVTIKAAKAA